ncbi:glycosyltransferase family 2 protein [Conexibacter sp. DBS9H8]|uniref:glycosyltransferase family 2 protein n=1 Tax=Conexibacter sp. DBS9H8 TaxID=2937801 RepID=UPI00200DA3CA|nr:glycosyltransferase family 2 protein [Conexibacter sp. DBS9H8]
MSASVATIAPVAPLAPVGPGEDTITPATEVCLSIVMPCLDEAGSIAECVRRAWATLARNGIDGEVLVVDNGSEDGSPEIARGAGARVISERRRGYGNAYRAGLAAARGRYILMVDADLTYDLEDAPRFLTELEAGADMVIGDRMSQIDAGAMSWSHRYIGNPLLSGFLNLLYRTPVSDAHCGMRALRRDIVPRLDLRTSGMEFASEMVIRAAKEQLDVREFPIRYHARCGESKLSTVRDGWRHLRFLLLHSPNHLFIFPGLVMGLCGLGIEMIGVAHLGLFGRHWQIHATLVGALLAIVGTQVLALGACARTYAAYFMGERDRLFSWARSRFTLEHGLAAGGLVTALGLALGVSIAIGWASHGFGALGDGDLAVLAATLIVIGVETFFTAFLLSILGLRRS